MNAEHKASLHQALEGDFVLVEQAGGYWYILLLSAFKLDGDDVRILIKSVHNPTKHDVWKYQQFGTWRFRSEAWSRDSFDVRAVLRKTDVLTVRPDVELLKRKLGCACLYEPCDQGLVRITSATQADVHFRSSPGRLHANRERRDLRSICPFCMGHTLFEQHEHLATHPAHYPMDIYATHLLAVNRKRQHLKYNPLPSDIDLATLQPSALAPPPPLNPALVWNLAAAFKDPQALPTKPVTISTHSYEWFKTSNDRVINDICGICRESYADGEVIADLPCLHFFHEECVKQAFVSKGGVAKCPLCQSVVDGGERDRKRQAPAGDVEVATRTWLAYLGS